jgi:hypothetical protein
MRACGNLGQLEHLIVYGIIPPQINPEAYSPSLPSAKYPLV